jgi:hypothetical protein
VRWGKTVMGASLMVFPFLGASIDGGDNIGKKLI